MNRRQAQILISAIINNKEFVLPSRHPHIRSLLTEGYVKESLHEVPFETATKEAVGTILQWIVKGACDSRNVDEKLHIVLWSPTDKAKQWFTELTQSQRNKDKRLLKESGYMPDDDVFETGENTDPNGPFGQPLLASEQV